MKVHRGPQKWQTPGRSVVTLGNYDGVHVGHQAILHATVQTALQEEVPSVAITFDPIPKKVLHPESAPPLIQTLDQRLSSMEAMGLDHAMVVRFDLTFAQKSPEEFVKEYLADALQVKAFVVGENFSFGYKKRGNIELLKRMGAEFDYIVKAIPEVRVDGHRVSSTAVREMIREGRVSAASRFLGRPFALKGTIVEGEKLGGTIGIPTANMKVENEAIPASGVYITSTILDGARHPSVTNVGVRPTVGGTKLTVETHLLDFEGMLYGRDMEVEFLDKLRDEKRFSSVEELKNAILSDIASARTYFRNR